MTTDTHDTTTTTTVRTRTDRLYVFLASRIIARQNCASAGNDEWFARHTDAIEQMARELLPSGAGVDSGTTVDLEKSTGNRIVLSTSFHHMNDGGMYAGWTEHTIVVRPSFVSGVELTISGRDRRQIKEYLADLFRDALTAKVQEAYDTTTGELS